MIGVLFVCMGNICRSPLAEALFIHRLGEQRLLNRYFADSAGTGHWHSGEPPDARSQAVAKRHGLLLAGKARQVRDSDFQRFQLIVAMDRDNLRDLAKRTPPSTRKKLHLMREYDPAAGSNMDVPDPYFGGASGFDDVYTILERSCEGLLRRLKGLDITPPG